MKKIVLGIMMVLLIGTFGFTNTHLTNNYIPKMFHNQLYDMPDKEGVNSDHDGRYVRKNLESYEAQNITGTQRFFDDVYIYGITTLSYMRAITGHFQGLEVIGNSIFRGYVNFERGIFVRDGITLMDDNYNVYICDVNTGGQFICEVE